MAVIYSMWIETENKSKGKAIKDFFENKKISVNGKNYVILAYEGGMITVDGISRVGIRSKADAEEMTSIGFEFYNLLMDAPEYRYALAGLEVDGWRWMSDLEEEPNDLFIASGVVIRKDIYAKIGSPGEMFEFTSNYVWTPYTGEKWNEN